MNITEQNGVLTLEDIPEMSAANARMLRDEMRAAYSPGLTRVDINMSEVRFVDGCGLGALAGFYKLVQASHEGEPPVIRLLYPQPPVQQLLELTRMHDIFEIVPHDSFAEECCAGAAPSRLTPSLT